MTRGQVGASLDISPLDVDPAEVYRHLGIRGGGAPSPAVRRLVERACEVGRGLVRPAARRVWLEASCDGSIVTVENGVRLNTGRPLQGWGDLERIAVCLCTLGPVLEERVAGLFREGDASLAVSLDAFGSAAMEALGERVREVIRAEAAAAGVNVGPHGEPGTGRWDLQQQEALFYLAAGDSLGVRITESAILVPLKSLCFVVPAGGALHPTNSRGPCEGCAMAGCVYRAL